MRLIALSLLFAVTLYGQGSQTPIYNGLLQSDLNAAGFKIIGSNMVDYAGTGMSWNAVTGKFDVIAGAGSGTVTSITATAPIVVTPSPLITTGAVSLDPTSKSNWDTAFTDRLKWDGGATGLVAATGRTSLGLVVGVNVQAWDTDLDTWATVTPATGITAWLATPSSANLRTAVTDETGTSGGLVFAGSPTITTPTIAALANLTTNGFVKTGGGIGTLSVDTTTYLSTAGDLSPLFTTTETAGNVAFSLSTAAANSWFGNATGSVAAPAFNTSVFPAALMPALTGPVTTTAGGVATTITNSAVTYAKIQNVSANSRLLGSGSAGTGLPPAEITVGSGLTMTGTTLTAAGGGGTVTNTGGNLTANSVVLGAGTVDTKVVPGVITDGTSKLTLGVSTTSVGSIALNNLTSGSVTIQPATGALSTATMTIPAGSTNPVIADTGAANNFLTGISTAGAITKAQPAFSNLTGSATAAQMPAYTGDVTAPAGSTVNTLVNIPDLTPAVGSILFTNIAAPVAPAATKDKLWFDTTDQRMHDKNTAGTIGTTAVSKASVGSQWFNSMSASGVFTSTQPAFTDLTGSVAATQMPALTGDVTTVAGAVATTIGTNKVTLGMMATMATDSILGRKTAATGNVEVLTALPWADTGDVTRTADGTATVLANIPLTTTIAGVAGTRGDVLYYGASGWAKLAAGTSGNQLTTNGAGADPTWAAAGSGGGGTPGGTNTQVQYNNSSAFGGITNATSDGTTMTLTSPKIVTSVLDTNANTLLGITATTTAVNYATLANAASGSNPTIGIAGSGTDVGLNINPKGLGIITITKNANTNTPGLEIKNTTAGTSSEAKIQCTSDGINQLQFGQNSSTTTAYGAAVANSAIIYAANPLVLMADGAGVYIDFAAGGNASKVRILNGLMVGTTTDPGAGNLGFPTGGIIKWGTPDTGIARNTAGVVEINNGTAGTLGTLKTANVNVTTAYQINGTAVAGDYINSSVSSQSPSTSDVYLTGSNVVVPAGAFAAKGQYRCLFDVTKTAGTGGIVLSVRTGTAGTTSDTANLTFTFPAGTSVADVGTFEVFVNWRTVGSGTSAVVSGVCRAFKNTVTAAGLWSDTSDAKTIVATVSSGFASNTFTNMGVSFNGGTAFAGTITTVQASLQQ